MAFSSRTYTILPPQGVGCHDQTLDIYQHPQDDLCGGSSSQKFEVTDDLHASLTPHTWLQQRADYSTRTAQKHPDHSTEHHMAHRHDSYVTDNIPPEHGSGDGMRAHASYRSEARSASVLRTSSEDVSNRPYFGQWSNPLIGPQSGTSIATNTMVGARAVYLQENTGNWAIPDVDMTSNYTFQDGYEFDIDPASSIRRRMPAQYAPSHNLSYMYSPPFLVRDDRHVSTVFEPLGPILAGRGRGGSGGAGRGGGGGEEAGGSLRQGEASLGDWRRKSCGPAGGGGDDGGGDFDNDRVKCQRCRRPIILHGDMLECSSPKCDQKVYPHFTSMLTNTNINLPT